MPSRLAACAASLLLLLGLGCDAIGGKVAIRGIGNSGNRLVLDGELEAELARGLVNTGAAERVSPFVLNEVFEAVVAKARRGDAQAALIVVKVAERLQRAADEKPE